MNEAQESLFSESDLDPSVRPRTDAELSELARAIATATTLSPADDNERPNAYQGLGGGTRETASSLPDVGTAARGRQYRRDQINANRKYGETDAWRNDNPEDIKRGRRGRALLVAVLAANRPPKDVA